MEPALFGTALSVQSLQRPKRKERLAKRTLDHVLIKDRKRERLQRESKKRGRERETHTEKERGGREREKKLTNTNRHTDKQLKQSYAKGFDQCIVVAMHAHYSEIRLQVLPRKGIYLEMPLLGVQGKFLQDNLEPTTNLLTHLCSLYQSTT